MIKIFKYGIRGKMKRKFGAIRQLGIIITFALIVSWLLTGLVPGPVLAATITTAGSGSWSSTTPNAPWPGGVIPGATDKVVIAAGHTVTVPGGYTGTCGDLNVTGTLTLQNTAGTLHVWGGGTSPVTTGAITGTGTISGPGSGGTNIEFTGNWSFSGTMSGYVSFYFDGSQDQDTAGGNVAFPRNLFIQKGGGTVYFPVTPTWANYFHITSAGGGTTDASTVCYNGGAQNVAVPESTTYHYYNLTLAGSGSKTISTSGIVVDGTLSIEGTATASAAPTYGSSATLRYNTATSRNAGPEWITPFAATGGVIIDNTGTITLNGAKTFSTGVPLTINSGATLSTSTSNYGLTFGGNYINNGGTLSAGSSNIIIGTGTATQSIAGFTTTGTVSMTKTAGTATFMGNVNGGGLTISGSGGTLNLGTGLTHNFTGTWTRTNGTLNGNSSTLNLGGGLSGTGGTFTANTGTVNYYGAAQTIAAVTYNNLIINQSSGGATLGGSITVNGVLTLTNGGITTGSNKVIIAAGGSVSRTSGHIIGNLQKYVATGSGVSPTFEVGTASGYDPIVVNFGSVSVAGNLTANVTAGEHPSIGTSAINSTKDVNVYWSFTNSGITFDNYGATFNFNPGDIDGSANATNFIVGKYSGGWTYPTVGTKTSTSTQVTGVTSLSDFVLGEVAAVVTFSTNSTFTVPAGVYQITVEAWGGGGGGGGTSSTGGAGGGGGGAYAQATINVTPGQTYNVTVGTGGVGGTGSGSGAAGGDSYFATGSDVRAKGGSGGTGGANGAGGLGGTATASNGTVKFSGGNGAAGNSSGSGGGGGGAGSQAAGGNASGMGGGTGGTPDGGAGGAGRNSNGAGSNGTALGGGGSGADRESGTSSYSGGAGADGEVIINCAPVSVVSSTIEVTAPSAIDFGTLAWGDNVMSSATSGNVTVTFGTDGATGWQVTANDTANGGFMKNGTTPLSSKLQISKDGSTWANADVGITYNGTGAGNYTLPFWAKQVINNATEQVGAYSIIIQFTGAILH